VVRKSSEAWVGAAIANARFADDLVAGTTRVDLGRPERMVVIAVLVLGVATDGAVAAPGARVGVAAVRVGSGPGFEDNAPLARVDRNDATTQLAGVHGSAVGIDPPRWPTPGRWKATSFGDGG
jgi:hypothetical protein